MKTITRQLTIMKGMARLRVPLLALLALAAALTVATGLAPPLPSAAQSGDTFVTAGNTTPCGPGAADPPTNPTPVINSGHYALFDVYWDNTDSPTSGKTLNANLCPPAVTTSKNTVRNRRGSTVTETFTRAASDIDIGKTLFHIPTGNKVSLAATTVTATEDGETYPTTFGTDEYGFLGDTGDELWIISAHDEEHLNPGFSTALLPDDFVKTGTKVRFELEAARVPGEVVEDRGTAFAFDNDGNVRWRSDIPHGLVDLDVASNIKRYHHLHWAFTKPGIYELQVHARATPTTAYFEVDDESVTLTSEVRRYTFQVGELADLGVTVTPDNATPTAGSNVVLTYTASNDGPDAAGAVKVSAPLPTGLTYVSATTANGSYASATGEWTVGSLASDASATLAVTATVGSGTTGDTLTPTAYIRDTGDNPDLDALTGNNHGTATLRPGAAANSSPRFQAFRTIAENADAGTPAGAPVAAVDTDGDSLAYTLSGQHSESFTVDDQGRIAVSECGVMDYEAHAVYPLTLSVSDGKNSAGEADTANDDSIGVTIKVADAVDEAANAGAPGLDMQPDHYFLTAGETVTLTATASRMPACGLNLDYYWRAQRQGTIGWTEISAFRGRSTATFTVKAAEQWEYRVDIEGATDSEGNAVPDFDGVRGPIHWITWVAPPPTPTPSP